MSICLPSTCFVPIYMFCANSVFKTMLFHAFYYQMMPFRESVYTAAYNFSSSPTLILIPHFSASPINLDYLNSASEPLSLSLSLSPPNFSLHDLLPLDLHIPCLNCVFGWADLWRWKMEKGKLEGFWVRENCGVQVFFLWVFHFFFSPNWGEFEGGRGAQRKFCYPFVFFLLFPFFFFFFFNIYFFM